MKYCEHGVLHYQGCDDCAEAELIAAVAAERERCAQVAEGFQKWGGTGIAITAQKIAKAIRGQS